MKRMRYFMVVVIAAVFIFNVFAPAYAGTFQIEPKKDKEIKIALLDLISAVETAGLANSWYKRYCEERGWELTVFDLGLKPSEAADTVENIITAGYDAILVNWVDFKYYAPQILEAYEKGIPVLGLACGNMVPGVVSHGTSADMIMGSMSSMALITKLHEGDKILCLYNPRVNMILRKFMAAEATFKAYNIVIAQQIQNPGSDEPEQAYYEMTKNALLGDTEKEIKGIWSGWDGGGRAAAKAVEEMGREDIVITMCDDSPRTYSDMRKYPQIYATAGVMGKTPDWTGRIIKNLDKIFAGEPFEDQEVWFSMPYLVTQDTMPPKGYFYNVLGYKGRDPDFEVK